MKRVLMLSTFLMLPACGVDTSDNQSSTNKSAKILAYDTCTETCKTRHSGFSEQNELTACITNCLTLLNQP